jgi:hypothetical protein
MARQRQAGVRVVARARERSAVGPTIWRLLGIAAALLIGFTVGNATGGPDRMHTVARPGPGPAREVAGVPRRFAHSREGAVAALLNYGATLGDPQILLNPSRRAQVLSLIATKRYAATFHGRYAAALEAVRRGPLGRGLAAGAQTAYLASPIAYRIVAYADAEAVVEGWGVAIVGNDQGQEPEATWGTTLTTARWENGDWRIDNVRSTAGPTPRLAPGQTPSVAGDFLARLSGLRGVRHAP